MEQTIFIFNNLLAFLVACLLSEIVFRTRPVWFRLFASVCSFSLVAVFVVVFLALVGRLSAFWVSAVLSTLFIAVVLIKNRQGGLFQSDIEDKAEAVSVDSLNKPSTFLGFIFAGILFGTVLGIIVLRGVTYYADDLSYHATTVAHWFIEERLSLAPVGSYHAYYPFNAEALSLWFILPFGSDGLVGLAGFYWICVLSFSVVCICIMAKYRLAAAVFAAVISLSPEVIKDFWQTFSAVDLAAAAMMLASSVMTIAALTAESRKVRFAETIYSGLFLGFAIGCKISFAPVFFILLLWFLFIFRHKRSLQQRTFSSLLFIAGVCLTEVFWYVRNLIITGNPLFPAEVGFFDGPFSPHLLARTKLIWWLVKPTQWFRIAQKLVSWPVGVFMLSAIGYFVMVASLLRRKKSDSSIVGMVLVSIGIVIILTHPMVPFSATDMSSSAKLRIGYRFLIGPFIIGLVLFSRLLCEGSFKRFWYAIAVLAIVTPIHIGDVGNCVMNSVRVVCGIVIILVWRRYGTFLSVMWNNKLLIMVFIFAVLLVLVVCLPYQQQLNDEKIFNYTIGDNHIGPAWRVLDGQEDGTRTVWFGNGSYCYYPLFGRRLQLRPVLVTFGGLPKPSFQEKWLRGGLSEGGKAKPDVILSSEELIANLKSCDVDCVLVSINAAGNWPRQYELLTSNSRTCCIYDNGQVAIFRLD